MLCWGPSPGCVGFQEGSGKIGTRWTVPEHQPPHGMLGNLLYPLNGANCCSSQTKKDGCPESEVWWHISHGFWLQALMQAAESGRVCVSVCVCECVFVLGEGTRNLKGHITLAVAPKTSSALSLGAPSWIEALEVATDSILELMCQFLGSGFVGRLTVFPS